jgi:hypothetical protein
MSVGEATAPRGATTIMKGPQAPPLFASTAASHHVGCAGPFASAGAGLRMMFMQVQPYLFFDGRCEEAVESYGITPLVSVDEPGKRAESTG